MNVTRDVTTAVCWVNAIRDTGVRPLASVHLNKHATFLDDLELPDAGRATDALASTTLGDKIGGQTLGLANRVADASGALLVE